MDTIMLMLPLKDDENMTVVVINIHLSLKCQV